MGSVSPNDSLYAECIDSPASFDHLCPQSLIDLMPSADEYLARLKNLALDFITIDYMLTYMTLGSVVDRVVAHLCTRDTHAAHLTLQ